jgi:N-acyl-D-amino-acid deacylase
VKILQHPAASVACDCGAVVKNAAHPRYYGTFPRVLGRYVREQRALTWEEAVRKMTGLPAATIGMVDRGLLAAGMAADVVIFDPATVIDHATFESAMLPSQGIRTVIVNGRVALRDGAATGERAGRALRRSPHMPSRPMPAPGTHTLARRAGTGTEAVVIDLRQSAGATAATGRVQVTQPASGVAMTITEFGRLQTAPGWASVTGRGRLRPSEPERSVMVIVDGDQVVVRAGEFAVSVATRR